MTRPANAERGEITLKLNGEDLGLRPTFEAITAFEEATGKGLFELATEALAFKLKVNETAMIATECIRAWGRAVKSPNAAANVTRITELILESDGGYKRALETIGGMLAMACTGGYTASGEVKAATPTMMTETAAD